MYQNKSVKIVFWDTAGQEIFNAMNTIYYQGAVGGIVVYEVANFDSFQKVQKWINELQAIVGKKISLVIAGNKYDLIPSREELIKQKGIVEPFCQKENIRHFYTSAKTGEGVNELFAQIIQDVLKKQKPNESGGGNKKRGLVLEEDTNQPKKKKGCC